MAVNATFLSVEAMGQEPNDRHDHRLQLLLHPAAEVRTVAEPRDSRVDDLADDRMDHQALAGVEILESLFDEVKACDGGDVVWVAAEQVAYRGVPPGGMCFRGITRSARSRTNSANSWASESPSSSSHRAMYPRRSAPSMKGPVSRGATRSTTA